VPSVSAHGVCLRLCSPATLPRGGTSAILALSGLGETGPHSSMQLTITFTCGGNSQGSQYIECA